MRVGTYVLLIDLPRKEEITVGRLGRITFPPGCYAYVGSAMGGLDGRIQRHLRKEGKKTHWHIDYLLWSARIKEVLCIEGSRRECEIARELSKRFRPVKGFGSSDCKCESHLFYGDYNTLRDAVSQLLPSD